MNHDDLLLLILGSFLPNNLFAWIYRKIFRRKRIVSTSPQRGRFARLAIFCGNAFGSPANFVLWIVLVSVWIWSGPMFHFSNTWQLMINTPTTIIELFAAILIQYVGNRIERRQEDHEQKMLDMLSEVKGISETVAAIIETNDTIGR